MTTQQLGALEEKFVELYWDNWMYPPLGSCDCPLYENEEGRMWQECDPSCENWEDSEFKEMGAFDSAASDLQEDAGLSTEETVEFVNILSKSFMPEYHINYRACDESSWIVTWSYEPPVTLALPAQASAQAIPAPQTTTPQDSTAPAGVAYLLWKMLPSYAQGDLEEEYAEKREALGEAQARRWLQKSVAASVWALVKDVTWKVVVAAAVQWITGQGDR